MTFLGYDTSRDDGAPVEFFEFILGTSSWRYTSADSEQVILGQVYSPAIISRDTKEQTGELTGKRMSITLTGYDPLVDKFRNGMPPQPMSLTIRNRHRGDPDAEAVIVWFGSIRGVDFNSTNVQLSGEHVAMAAGRVGLYRYYENLCSRVWGSGPCGVESELYRTDGAIDSIDAIVIYCTTGQADEYFTGGYARVGDDYRLVIASSPASITVQFPFFDIVAGEIITMYAGCNRSFQTCIDKFSNGINFGGAPYVPNSNVFIDGVR